jgi:hypothetical protein
MAKPFYSAVVRSPAASIASSTAGSAATVPRHEPGSL